jgi:hypothetical protein
MQQSTLLLHQSPHTDKLKKKYTGDLPNSGLGMIFVVITKNKSKNRQMGLH